MSVIVTALPAVEAAQLPPLRSLNKDGVFCLQKTPLVLPVEGAPVVFSTDIAHDFVLHLQNQAGEALDLPAAPDPSQGGFVVDAHALTAAKLDPGVKGTVRGYWGFDSFEGPAFNMVNAHPAAWTIPAADQGALIAGREDTIHADADTVACVDDIRIQDRQGTEIKTTWKAAKPNELEIHVPLKDEAAGALKMTVQQFGAVAPDQIDLHAYTEAAKLVAFKISAGDQQGVLTGTRLDQVNSVELMGIRFQPAKLERVAQEDELSLSAAQAAPATALTPGEQIAAHVGLKDGRVLDLQTTVESPRPKVAFISKNLQPGPARSAVHLSNPDSLPQDGRMTFFLKTEIPESFPRTEKIEVATSDGSFQV